MRAVGEENRKEHVVEETEAIVNEASQENQDIEAKENPNPEEENGAGGCAGLKDGSEAAEDGGSAEAEAGEDVRDGEEAGEGNAGADSQDGENGGPSESGKKGGGSSAEKRGFFGKKKEKKDPKDAQIEELTDRLRRTMAEFDNFRKRTEKEKSAMFEIGAKDIVERILPVIDNFERGLASVPEDAKGSAFAEGMEMIYKQLLKNLEEAGVKPIDATGQPFDPNFHNAVMHIEDENLGENVVAQELQKGYMYRDSVVRHSMVQVAN